MKQSNEVWMKEALAIIADGDRVLREADTLRRNGLKIRAQGFQLKYDTEKEMKRERNTETV